MDIPERVLNAIGRKKKEEQKVKKAVRDTNKKLREKLEKLHQEKISRWEELEGYAKTIINWVQSFKEDRRSKGIFKCNSRVFVFCGKFFGGFPIEVEDVSSFCDIYLKKNGNLECWERYKYHPAHAVNENIKLTAEDLILELHPKLLQELAESMQSNRVWNFIISRI